MDHDIIRRAYCSPAREAFLRRTSKVMPNHPGSALYINTTDPSYYEKRLRCNRHDVRALYCIGRRYERAGAIVKAREYYERAVAVDPYYEPAIGALLILQRKEEYSKRLREAKAMREREACAKRKRGLSSFRAMQTVMISYLIILLLVFGVLLR